MNNLTLYIFVLTAIALVGIIVLAILGKDFSTLSYVVTAFSGWLVGKEQDRITKLFTK